jgi:hypothetical protein
MFCQEETALSVTTQADTFENPVSGIQEMLYLYSAQYWHKASV